MRDSEIYKIVSQELGVDIKRVEEYDKKFWQNNKLELNNPDWDVYEIPFFGTWTMTKAKLHRTLKYELRLLKKSKASLLKKPNNTKLRIIYDAAILKFRELWKLKKELKW